MALILLGNEPAENTHGSSSGIEYISLSNSTSGARQMIDIEGNSRTDPDVGIHYFKLVLTLLAPNITSDNADENPSRTEEVILQDSTLEDSQMVDEE